MRRDFMTGNSAVVRGALRAGCDFFAGYPITPASSILTGFIRAFDGTSGVAVETEDEMAAIGQCIGASMAGAKPMTATSGPGLSLYSENIGLAQMGEVPLVIVDCQRMGPSTGGATASSDGDVIFARHVTSGSYPLPVLAATDAGSAYWLTGVAFNIAERLRTPTILLLSKEISLTRQTVEPGALPFPAPERRAFSQSDRPFRPYEYETLSDVPRFAPVGGPQRVRFTGSIHDPDGCLTIDPAMIDRKLRHLAAKIDAAADSISFVSADLDEGASTLVISYGAASSSAADAVRRLRIMGTAVSHLVLYTLWPLPERSLREAIGPGIRRVIMPELNLGLYAAELRRVVHDVPVLSEVRLDGRLISPARLVQRVLEEEAGCLAV